MSTTQVCGGERGWSAVPNTEVRAVAKVTVRAAGVGLAVALTAVLTAGPWDSGQRTAERERAAARDARDRAWAAGTGLPGSPAPQVLAGVARLRGRLGELGRHAAPQHASAARLPAR